MDIDTDELSDEVMFRLGTAIAGAFVGALVGFLVFLPLNMLGVAETPFLKAAMAGAASGGLCGAVFPRLAFAAFEGTIQFFFGLFSFLIGAGDLHRSEAMPRWLYAAFLVGGAYGIGVWLVLIATELVMRGAR